MFIRASTKAQDVNRTKAELNQLTRDHGQKIAVYYLENESGVTPARAKIRQTISAAYEGNMILFEQIDRLARLNQSDWDTLKQKLSDKKLAIVSKELLTSFIAFQTDHHTEFMNAFG